MKLRIVAIAFVALVLVSLFADVTIAESEENTEPDDTGFINSEAINSGGDPEEDPLGGPGGDDGGGGTPW